MLNLQAKIIVFVSIFFTFNTLYAAHSSSLYDVDVLVEDESATVRWGAFKRGMDEVFVRISGDTVIMSKLKRPAPTLYVQRYSYDPVADPVTGTNGKTLTHRLKIQYNGSIMEKYLLDNGFAVWGEHRPKVVIWLVVRDGRNEYVLKSTDQSLLKTAAEAALTRRGVPEVWPAYDYKDKKILKVADIRGGFQDPVTQASKRYSRGPSLTGSLIWSGREWQSSWSVLMASGDQHWSLVDTNYTRLINNAIDKATDAMGAVFAVHDAVNEQQFTTIQLEVEDVNSITRYRHIENYLTELNSVEFARPLRVDGQKVMFEVLLRSEEKDFLNLIKNDAELTEITSPPVANDIKPTAETPDIKAGDKIAKDLPLSASDTSVNDPQVPVYYYRLAR